MNKELYDTLAATEVALKDTQLDKETRRYLEKSLLKRKLNGKYEIMIILCNFINIYINEMILK